MSIQFFSSEDFSTGSIIDPVDTFTGDGSTTTFTLVNKSVQRLGSTIQVDTSQFWQYNSAFTKNTSNNTFTLSSAPGLGSQIVAPGISQIIAAAFDQDPVPGVTDPTVAEVPFWIGDSTDILGQYYTNLPAASGIEIALVDLISGAGASTSWCQLACASPTTGLAMTYGATGGTLYTSGIYAFGVLSASAAAGASSVLCTTASAFQAGDYVILNIGTASQEIRKITTVTNSPGQLDFSTAFDFSHAVNETVMTCGRKFWLKVTVPIGVASNTAANFYDIGIRRRGKIVSRI